MLAHQTMVPDSAETPRRPAVQASARQDASVSERQQSVAPTLGEPSSSAWSLSGLAWKQQEFHRQLLELQQTPAGLPLLKFTTQDFDASVHGPLQSLVIPWKPQ